MEVTGTLTEAELADFLEHKVVSKLWFVQLGKDRYEVIAAITWKPGQWRLLTQRKKPKEWVNLDRMAKHMLSKCINGVPPIELVLDEKFNDGYVDTETDH